MARFVSFYRSSSVFVTNILLLGVVLNLGAALYLASVEPPPASAANPVQTTYGDRVYAAYPGWPRSDVDGLLAETWNRPLAYEPYTHFKEAACSGTWVNVHPRGFRYVENQAPWPPDPKHFNIFLFGGSTTFGYGLPDNLTIASRLQTVLDGVSGQEVRVYNFGRAYYYSTQERVLFEALLVEKTVPDLAVFIDGLNDFYPGYSSDEPLLSKELRRWWAKRRGAGAETAASSHRTMEALERLPLVRLARQFRRDRPGDPNRRGNARVRRLLHSRENPLDPEAGERLIASLYDPKGTDPAAIDQAVDRYVANMHLIAAAARRYDVAVLFAWQPVPTYRYDLHSHLFLGPGLKVHKSARFGAQRIDARRAEFDDPFLWLGDLFEDVRAPMYVDAVHYNADAADRIAVAIAQNLRAGGLDTARRPAPR